MFAERKTTAPAMNLLQVAAFGGVIAGWLGMAEGWLLWRSSLDPILSLNLARTFAQYVVMGLVVGGVWAWLGRRLAGERGTGFYALTLPCLIAVLQLAGHPRLLARPVLLAVAGAVLLTLLVVAWRLPRGPGKRALPGWRTLALGFLPLPLLLVLGSIRPEQPAPAGAGLPNVLLIVLDTTRLDRLSAYGHDLQTTPALERLAVEGALFTRAYSASPWTLPSHASIFSSELPSVHRAAGHHTVLDDGLPTLAEHLGRRGLRTAAFYYKAWLRRETGVMRGFSELHNTGRKRPALPTLIRAVGRRMGLPRAAEDKGATFINRRFDAWLEHHGQAPWFVFVNYNEAHAPYRPRSPFREQYLGKDKDTSWGRSKDFDPLDHIFGRATYTPADLEILERLYDAGLAYQDLMMGELLDGLRRRGLLDDTIVIVTADHGEHLGSQDRVGHSWDLYEPLVHVPLVVRYPRKIPAGLRVDGLVENRRIWQLVDALLGAEEAGPLGPAELVSVLREEDEETVLTEFYKQQLPRDASPIIEDFNRGLRALRWGDLKYIWGEDGKEELFDLSVDPHELHDLAAERPEELAQLRQLLAAQVRFADDLGVTPNLSEETKRRLRAMGYLN